MRTLLVIGIGAGNPEHVTVQAITAMNTVDVFFVVDKGDRGSGTERLVTLRREICERYIDRADYRFVQIDDPQRDRSPVSYGDEVLAWHAARARLFERAIVDELGPDDVGAFLVWGDPSLYDSTLRIVDQILETATVPFAHRVVPGITSVQALAASHRTVLHGVGESLQITTGRLLADGLADDTRNAVVMLDANNTFTTLDGDAYDIYWGAYLGTPDEIVVAGRLADVRDAIERVRTEARARHGWIMDIYLLRRVDRERSNPLG